MKRFWILGVVFILTVGAEAWSQQVIELYSAEDNQLFGPGANGKRRSQHFSPTQSTPTSLDPSVTFVGAAFRLRLNEADTVDGTLELFAWAGDYTTTIGGTPIASLAVNLTGPYVGWQELTFDPQSASGQYLLSFHVGTVTGTDFGLYRSDSDDGGPNNDAYNDDSLKTDREYQVRLSIPPSTAVKDWEIYE